MGIVSVQRKNYLWLLFRFIKVYGTHFLAGDSWRSRSKDYRDMAGAPVNYRLSTKLQNFKHCKSFNQYEHIRFKNEMMHETITVQHKFYEHRLEPHIDKIKVSTSNFTSKFMKI